MSECAHKCNKVVSESDNSGVTDLFIGGDVNNIQILTAHLLPGADSNRDLGSPTRRWQDGFFTNIPHSTLIEQGPTFCVLLSFGGLSAASLIMLNTYMYI